MSKVYSFRLDFNNPREAQAREVINAWVLKGYSLRQVVIKALLNTSNENDSSKDLEQLIEKLGILLERVDYSGITLKSGKKMDSVLPPAFLESISKTLKPGEKIENNK
jgi:hypothetical protein